MDEHLLEVYLINTARHTEETPVAEWVSLPTDAETMKAVFERLGVDGSDTEQYQVSAFHSSLDGWSEALKPGESLDDLNYLAALLTQRSNEERDKFAAAAQYGDHAASAADLINLTHNLDCYWLYPTVHNSDDYGHYLIDDLDELELPDAAKRFFDYKSYGREAVKEDRGIFTDYGYVYNNGNDYAEWYKASQVPQEYRLTAQPSPQRDMDEPPQGAALPVEPTPVRPLVLNATDTQGRIKEITEHLEQGVQEVFESERYRDYLKAMSRFHNYSLNNTLLIVMQKPDASLIAGYGKWRDEFERHVKSGEKGIKILAPAPYKIKKDVAKTDPDTGQPVIGADGKPVTEQQEVTIPAFKVVSVFDVSQTEGKELPDIAVDALTGNVEQYEDFWRALKLTSPVPVTLEKIDGSAHGYYDLAEKRIAIDDGMSELQTIKTAIHEIAHAKLHDIDLNAPKDEQQPRVDRRTREVEAESGQKVTNCYQCGNCTAGCPCGPEYDLQVSQVMRAVQLGNKEMALSSRSLWLCVSCSTCTSRCPNNIDVAKVMDVLRHMAWKEGKTNYAMASFWQSFLTTVRHFGRTYELGVMAMFMARTGRVFTDVDLAPRILPKQKLPFKPHTIVGKDAVARIFKRFDEQRSAEGDK